MKLVIRIIVVMGSSALLVDAKQVLDSEKKSGKGGSHRLAERRRELAIAEWTAQ